MKEDIIENAKKYVNKLLMPLEDHYYHSYNHALDVMERARYLSIKEWFSKEDVEMMELAWLFHDTGFIIQYDKNEPIWAKIASNYLKSILYPKDRIKKIESLILTTDPDYKNPKDKYEEIIRDADMDNLWREDFLKKNKNLRKEIEIIKHIKFKDPDWKHASIDLLKEFQYKTISQKLERDKQKSTNLKSMLEDLEKENK